MRSAATRSPPWDPQEDLESLEVQAREVIDARSQAVMPGLVNAHTHAAMTLFRGLADDLPLAEWLQNRIFPAERRINGEWVYWGTLLACAEMIASGTTTFCDMYLFEEGSGPGGLPGRDPGPGGGGPL